MSNLSLKHMYKVYPGGVRAVSDFSLDIDDKEFIVFVGPSGCGKSTTLRMIAGLEDISAGELYIDNRLVNDVEPKDRDIAMVFQNYALYPHMTVRDNMAFGLKLRHVPKDIIDKKVNEAAAILGIENLLNRRPKALSGGQRQRVALGRAIVREPKVFLLDEPLSNLDAKLRVQMRTEITKIHHKLATTFIYVTHDQTEAMTMGTRIVVMKDGVVQQVDTPTTLYDSPANLFVACFLGSPQMNIFKAKLIEENGDIYALIGETNKVMIPKSRALRIIDKSIVGSEVLMGIRPEDVHYEQALVDAHPESVVEATVDVIENLGNETILYLNIDGKEDYTIARVNARYTFTQGEVVKMYFATEHAHLFDPTTELTLMGVPDYNMIPAQAVVKDGSLAVMFGDTRIDLPQEMLSCITDKSIINDKVILAIAPDALTTAPESKQEPIPETAEPAPAQAESTEAQTAEPVPDSISSEPEPAPAPAPEPAPELIEIQGVAEFYDDYPRFKAVYLTVAGVPNKVIMATPLDYPFMGGETVTMYLDPNKVQLFNCDGERLVADMPITGNTSFGTIVNTNNTYSYKFQSSTGKNKLAYDNFTMEADANGVKQQKVIYTDLATADAETRLYVDSRGVTIDKDVVAKNGKMALSGVILHLYEYHKDAIVTVKVDGFDGNMTLIIRNFSGYNEGEKIKFVVDPRAIHAENYVPFAEAIATQSAIYEGEMRYKEIVAAREKERELEEAAKAKSAKAEQAAVVAEEATEETAEEATEEAPAKKKSTVKKPAAKKPAAKKPAAKKPAAKKPAAKKAPVVKPTTAKKPAAKKPTTKK